MTKPTFDHSKLVGRIIEKFGTRAKFCEHIGMAKSTLASKLRGNHPFSTDDIDLMCAPDNLDIPPTEIVVYFFTPKVR